MHPLYVDIPLPKPSEQIRLLRWEASDEELPSEETARYSLSTHDCTGAWPQYVAVSYTWGDPLPTLPIQVNGYTLQIRLPCWHALWQLRHHMINHDLWIDSICINQKNTAEKGAQVAMMGKIFGNAESVAACIGTGTVLKRLKTALTNRDGQLAKDVFNELERLPYFERLWIKQEIILGKDVFLFSGQDKVPWDNLDESVAILPAHLISDRSKTGRRHARSLDSGSVVSVGDPMPQLPSKDWKLDASLVLRLKRKWPTVMAICYDRKWGNRRKSNRDSFSKLICLLGDYGDSKCDNVLDKVYALLSLLPKDDPGHRLIPDYTISTFSLFENVLQVACEARHSFMDSDALPILHQLLRLLNLNTKTAEISELIRRRRKMVISGNPPQPEMAFPYASFRLVRFLCLINADDMLDKLRRKGRPGFYYAGLIVNKPQTRSASISEEAYNSPEEAKAGNSIICATTHWTIPPGVELRRFWVSNEVRAGDILVSIISCHDEKSRSLLLSYAILRESSPASSTYILCSWAALDATDRSFFQKVKESKEGIRTAVHKHSAPSEKSYRNKRWVDLGPETGRVFNAFETGLELNLHYEDILSLVLRTSPDIRPPIDMTTTATKLSSAVLPDTARTRFTESALKK